MKRYWLPFACTILLTCGCRKQAPSPAGFRTSSLLTKITWSGVPSNGLSFIFSYNNEGLVSKVTNTAWGTGSYNGGPWTIWTDTNYTWFEYSNGRVSKSWDTGSGAGSGYFRYQYDNKGRLQKKTYYSTVYVGPDSASAVPVNDVPLRFYSFLYDDEGNLSEVADSSDGRVNFRFTLTYNEHNDLVSCVNLWYNGTSTPRQKEKYEWSDFDDKINFIAAVHGLPASFQWDNSYGSYSSSSPNNFTTVKYYSPGQADQPFTAAYTTSRSYQYDNEGLPVKITDGPWTITLEYRQ